MSIGTTAIRGVAGPLFVGHGTQKLFGWFGGHGLEGTSGFFESIGLRPGRRNAIAAGAAEAIGGALLTLGALTPVAAALITGTMTTAIRKVHAKNGPWVTEQGYEYNAVLIALMALMAETGPGRPSVDARLFPSMKGTGWAALAVGAGVAGSFLVDGLSEEAPEAMTQASSFGDPASPSTQEARFTHESPTAR
ncbi:MAG TPA: DoxX family protein [Baekduia sp.]|nr:DoxX family protein [Baekduia sp.]